jgi:hypothetical protein
MLVLFKEPNTRSQVLGLLTEKRIFMPIRKLESPLPQGNPANDRKWVYLGVEEQFGYVYFGVTTLFQEVIPSEG